VSRLTPCIQDDHIVPCWRYLLGLQTTPLSYSQAFIADFFYFRLHRRYYNRSILTQTVSTIALSVDSRVPRQFPYCTVLLALLYSKAGRWLLTALRSVCPLSCSSSSPTASFLLSLSLPFLSSRRVRLVFFFLVTVEIQPKVACDGPDRSHLAQLFRYPLSRVGYRGDVCCPLTMHSSGFILGTANLYHGYRFAVEWQRHSCTGDSVAPAAARHNIIVLVFLCSSL
jgi:hypothetical protein